MKILFSWSSQYTHTHAHMHLHMHTDDHIGSNWQVTAQSPVRRPAVAIVTLKTSTKMCLVMNSTFDTAAIMYKGL